MKCQGGTPVCTLSEEQQDAEKHREHQTQPQRGNRQQQGTPLEHI